MRAQAEWNVITHMARARLPTSSSTRSRISWAALLVKVIARISPGRVWPVPTKWAMRWVSTRVLPEPAPARISSGPSPCSTASRCGGFRPARRDLTRSAGSGTRRILGAPPELSGVPPHQPDPRPPRQVHLACHPEPVALVEAHVARLAGLQVGRDALAIADLQPGPE